MNLYCHKSVEVYLSLFHGCINLLCKFYGVPLGPEHSFWGQKKTKSGDTMVKRDGTMVKVNSTMVKLDVRQCDGKVWQYDGEGRRYHGEARYYDGEYRQYDDESMITTVRWWNASIRHAFTIVLSDSISYCRVSPSYL